MKVILTGGSGFVGQNLYTYLKDDGIDVINLSLRDSEWKNNFVFEGKAIIHLAGKAHDTSCTSAEEEYFAINRDLTIDLFQQFLKSDICDFIYFSSVKAVADSIKGELKEDIIGDPLTPYGKSKLEAENYLLGQKLGQKKRLFIIRPCMIHGPNNKGNLNLLFNIVKRAIPWPLASFHNQRSFLSVDNLCFMIEKIIKNDSISSGIYNFSDDSPLSTNELVLLISNCLDKKGKLWYFPPKMIKIIAKIGDIVPIPLNSERLKKLTESYIVSNEKIKNELGIKELPMSVKEGLKKTIFSFKKV